MSGDGASHAASVEERIAGYRAKQAAREAEREKELLSLELTKLELIDRFESELGPINREFRILSYATPFVGCIVLKRGPAVLYRKLRQSKVTPKDVEDFVVPQVAYPEKDEFRKLAGTYDALYPACLDELYLLHAGKLGDEQGKA
jgi:hypothetical protein